MNNLTFLVPTFSVMSNGNQHTRIIKGKGDNAPDVQLYGTILECAFQFEGQYSYAVSLESGSIVTKGEFLNGFRLDISELPVGFYQLVIFNELQRFIYSFRVE
ncbi:MAG: hypothetical protein R3277_06535 [Brumimicrobium sp.]|nr:hypothetical protein [Brumimicrobium sp.]